MNATLEQHTLSIRTDGRGLIPLNSELRRILEASPQRQGLCTVFCRHTSASLLINEGADPEVTRDLERFFARIVPDGDPLFLHRAEGPDDMPAHVRTALTQTSLAIPFADGVLSLGTWQEVFLWEHRAAPHTRTLSVTLVGTPT
ncbi:MAG: secondary thiamine-phosphate synthase enzyme YjbQ [Nannocystaceae bacterium]